MRTLKKKFISVMLVFTLLMAVFMPLTTYARTILPAEQTGDMHIWITASDGVLHWDEVAGATSYTVKICQQISSHAYKTENVGSNLTYNLYAAMDNLELENNEYRIEVYANGAGINQNMVIYYDNPYERLSSPTNLHWDGNIACWDAVPNAEHYTVYIEKTTQGSTAIKSNVTGTSVDLSYLSPEGGWYFSVIAEADGYLYSKSVDSPRKSGGTITTRQVTFNLNGGSMTGTNPVTVNDGETVTRPSTDPTRDGFVFVNWYSNEGLTSEFNFSTPITADTIIYAKWTPAKYTITLDPNNGTTETDSITNIDYNQSYGLGTPSSYGFTTPAGKEFDGWLISGNKYIAGQNFTVTSDLTAVAQWVDSTTPHTHDLTLVPAKEATCTEAGNNAYYTCSGCTKVFKDALGNVETTVVAETLPIDTDAHDWNDWVETTPATVDTAGEKTRTCKHDASHIETLPIEKLALEITEGGNKTYTLESGAKVQIKCNGTLANFDKLTSNGIDVDSTNYTKESGSTILTLKNAYLDSLSEETYTLAFVYNDGRKAETNLTIAKANTPADTADDDTNTTTGDNTTTDTTNTTDNTTNGTTTGGETKTSNSPKTGDNIVMYIAIMLVSALGVVGTIKFIKKRD